MFLICSLVLYLYNKCIDVLCWWLPCIINDFCSKCSKGRICFIFILLFFFYVLSTLLCNFFLPWMYIYICLYIKSLYISISYNIYWHASFSFVCIFDYCFITLSLCVSLCFSVSFWIIYLYTYIYYLSHFHFPSGVHNISYLSQIYISVRIIISNGVYFYYFFFISLCSQLVLFSVV